MEAVVSLLRHRVSKQVEVVQVVESLQYGELLLEVADAVVVERQLVEEGEDGKGTFYGGDVVVVRVELRIDG